MKCENCGSTNIVVLYDDVFRCKRCNEHFSILDEELDSFVRMKLRKSTKREEEDVDNGE